MSQDNNSMKVESLIGQGTYGKVYCIRDGEERSALKIIEIPSEHAEITFLKNAGMSDKDIHRYYDESANALLDQIKIKMSMKNKYFVEIKEVQKVTNDDGGCTIYVKMELLENLNDYISKHPGLTTEDYVSLGIKIADALSSAEIYRVAIGNVKPDNVFIRDNMCVLGDLGIGNFLMKDLISPHLARGRNIYGAPELYRGEEYNNTADIYSLGLMLYQFFNHNRLPFLEESMTYEEITQSLRRRASAESFPYPDEADAQLGAIIMKACSSNPKDRYANANEFKGDLEAYLKMIESPIKQIQSILEDARKTGDVSERVRKLSAAADLNRDNTEIQTALAQAYHDSEDYEDAIDIYKKLVITHPQDMDLSILLGRNYEANEEPAKAMQAYERALLNIVKSRNSNYKDAYEIASLLYGYCAKKAGEGHRAIVFAKQLESLGFEASHLEDVLGAFSLVRVNFDDTPEMPKLPEEDVTLTPEEEEMAQQMLKEAFKDEEKDDIEALFENDNVTQEELLEVGTMEELMKEAQPNHTEEEAEVFELLKSIQENAQKNDLEQPVEEPEVEEENTLIDDIINDDTIEDHEPEIESSFEDIFDAYKNEPEELVQKDEVIVNEPEEALEEGVEPEKDMEPQEEPVVQEEEPEAVEPEVQESEITPVVEPEEVKVEQPAQERKGFEEFYVDPTPEEPAVVKEPETPKVIEKTPKVSEETLKKLEEAVNEQPEDLKGLLNLASKYKESEKYSEAKYTYKKAIALNPEEASAYTGIASVNALQGTPIKAIDYYEKGIMLMLDQGLNTGHDYEMACESYAYLVAHTAGKHMSSHFQTILEKRGYRKQVRLLKQMIRRESKK